MNNFPPDNLMGKEGYFYGVGCQHHGSSGTGHCSCDTCSYILGGMPTLRLPQSHKETYTGWDNKSGKISTSGLLQYIFT